MLAWGGVAWAQAPTETPEGANSTTENASGQLEEVVVTAEKRTEDVQKIPIVVETASADDLERSGALQLRDLERAIPDVIIAPQGPAVTLMIRGVFSTDTSPGSENADAINLDGAYLAKTQGIAGMLFDVQRIEVAEGPQGTLYGRNANGGAINIITNKAQVGQDSATGTLEIGSYQLEHADGAINMAVGDTFAVRAAFHDLSHQGYYIGGLDDADEKGARVGFTWKPTDAQSLWMTYDDITIGGTGAGGNVVFATPGSDVYVPSNPRDASYFTQTVCPPEAVAPGCVVGTPAAYQAAAGNRNYIQNVDQQNNGATAQYDDNIGFATFTAEANWRRFHGYSHNINNFADTLDTTTGLGIAGGSYVPQHFESESLELRLTSNTTATSPLQWVVGLYGFNDIDGGTMIGYPYLLATQPSIQIANGFENGNGNGEHAISDAAFGQLTWTPIDRFHITAGLRGTYDHKSVQGIFTQFGTGPIALTPPKSNHWSKGTGTFGLNYDVTQGSMVYAKVSTGYEAGGFSYGPGVNPAAGPVYGPETITAYEIGNKNTFFDGTVRFNWAAWIYKYKDYQTNLALFANAVPGPPVLTATSAGKAHYHGASADLEWAVTKNDLLKGSVTFLTAHYDEFVAPAPPGYTTIPGVPNAPEVLTGEPIFTIPAADGTVSYDHIFGLPRGSFDWQLSANFKGNTLLAETAENGFGLVQMYQKAFVLWNTSLRYDSQNGKWSATLYDNNIANSIKYRSGAISTPSYTAPGYYETAQLYDPRIIGLILQAHL